MKQQNKINIWGIIKVVGPLIVSLIALFKKKDTSKQETAPVVDNTKDTTQT